MPGPRTDWDCGDNSCRYAGRGRGGMRTNGSCRCDDKAWCDIVGLRAALSELLPWAENWLPDEAKDQGARAALAAARTALGKK